ncbi:MAG: (Fe-S)-binding protein [Corynebacterium sp.]|nr:(Fe-S)-binding protein [Corynebacterium sp.]
MPVTTTTVFGIAGIVLSLPAWFVFLRGATRLYRFIAAGQPSPGRTNQPLRRFWTLIKEVFFHTELARKPVVAIAHWFVMVGFLIGSLVWFEAYIQTFNPAGGWPILHELRLYHFIDEVLGLATVLGILALIGIRVKVGSNNRIDRFYGSNARAAHFVEGVVLVEGLGMILVKAGKIATFGHGDPIADFLSIHLAKLLPASPELVSGFALVKLLTGMVWLFVVGQQLHWGVAWHRFLAFFNIFLQRNPDGRPALGALPTIDLDDSLGVGTIADAPWKMLLDAATCTECGRCQELCPAWNTGKPLSPKKVITDLRDAALDGVDVLQLVGNTIAEDELWSCTNCGACVEQCPVDIEHIDHVANLRRFQVLAESEFPSELTSLFKNLETKGNPWGRNNSERATWIEEARRDGLTVPEFDGSFEDTEYLFWVGCAGAFDDDGKKTTRAIVELLETAGVKYSVLSKTEGCTGDPARRAGNEFLFQTLATANVDTLNEVFDGVPAGQRKIITSCAHCFNTLRNEYPDFGGHYDVLHQTQLLNRLVREGRLKPVPRPASARTPITYHDPCFLGRHNKVFDPPRELIDAAGAELRDMQRAKNEGFCCGAGGARMFMEEHLGTRISDARAEEAISTGATEIATACPYCTTMLVGGVKAKQSDVKVRDVAQMLRDSILIDGTLPPAQTPEFLDPPKRTPKPLPAPKAPSSPKVPTAPKAPSSPSAAAPPPITSAVPVVPAPPVAPGPPKVSAVPVPPGNIPAAPVVPAAPGVSAPVVPAPPGNIPPPPKASAVPAPPGSAISAPPSVPAPPTPPSSPVPPPPPSVPGPPRVSVVPGPPGLAVPTPPAPPSVPTPPSVPPPPITDEDEE